MSFFKKIRILVFIVLLLFIVCVNISGSASPAKLNPLVRRKILTDEKNASVRQTASIKSQKVGKEISHLLLHPEKTSSSSDQIHPLKPEAIRGLRPRSRVIKETRESPSDAEVVEVPADPNTGASYQQVPQANHSPARIPWVFQPPQQQLLNSINAASSSFRNSAVPYNRPTQARTRRNDGSTNAGGGHATDFGETISSGGTGDVVVNLLTEVAGLQSMMKELVAALHRDMQGVGVQFAKIQTNAVELQQRFETTFGHLNTTMLGLYSQVSAEVASLKADVYRLHAALQGTTPSGQRLIVQPDRLDPARPKAIGVDCASLYQAGARESGVYMLQPDPADNTTKMAAYCDMKTAGGGWTVVQRRVDGSEDFYRSWRSYKEGFGSLLHDYWLGLDNLHRLTRFGNTHLRVELQDWDNNTRVGEYRYVRVMDESDGYRILAGTATGDAGDPFHAVAYTSRLQSMRFSTFDVDNDMSSASNCAKTFTSGWWFNSCFSVNLNGVWYGSSSYVGPSMNGIIWELWDHHSKGYSLKATEIKVRTENFT